MTLLLFMILHDTPPFPSLILYDTPHHSLPPPSSSITNFSITQTIHVLHKLAALFVVKEGESIEEGQDIEYMFGHSNPCLIPGSSDKKSCGMKYVFGQFDI